MESKVKQMNERRVRADEALQKLVQTVTGDDVPAGDRKLAAVLEALFNKASAASEVMLAVVDMTRVRYERGDEFMMVELEERDDRYSEAVKMTPLSAVIKMFGLPKAAKQVRCYWADQCNDGVARIQTEVIVDCCCGTTEKLTIRSEVTYLKSGWRRIGNLLAEQITKAVDEHEAKFKAEKEKEKAATAAAHAASIEAAIIAESPIRPEAKP